MKVSSEKIKPKFQEIEIKLTIQSQCELNTIKSFFGSVSAHSIKSAVAYHDEKIANSLDLKLISELLYLMHNQLK